MKRTLVICFLLLASINGFSQVSMDQNGLKTTVTGTISNHIAQAQRFEIAKLGFNSYHWQYGGLIIIELFHQYYANGYEKYLLEPNNGNSVLKLVESHGVLHNAKVSLGPLNDLSSSNGGFANKVLTIYLDLKGYSGYKVKLTYMQDKVELVTDQNQIKINTEPLGELITDFAVQTVLNEDISSSGNLMITGNGPHYIENGNVGIGITTPAEKLAVNGNIRAKEIKVENNNWPDYVFATSYQLPSLQETEKHIKEKGHLPGIPSAEEVKANGVDLGEMNAKLLQKLEELTLHLISEHKKNEVQEQKIRALVERLNKIENH